MTNTYNHAQRELDILVKSNTDPDNKPIIEEFIPEILELCKKFGNSGQSGGSAPYVANAISSAIKKLLLFNPICPITGLDEEWTEDSFDNDDTYQNNRLSSVFKKGKDGKAYFLDAIVWQGEEEYDTFTGTINGITSRQYIKSFPFEPKTFYIDVVKDFNIAGKYVYKIKDENQLSEVFDYYDKFSFND